MAASAEGTDLKEQTEKMKNLTYQALDAMGEEVSFSYTYTSGQPPFKLQEVVAVKDADAMKAMMNEAMVCANDLYEAMGIPASLTYEQGVSTYKDTPIDVVKISVTDTDDPNNQMQQEMEKMYGGNFLYYLAQTPKKFYITMGPDSENMLKMLIDQPDSAPTPEDMKTAMDTLNGTPYNDFVCSVNVIKLAQGIGDMLQTIANQAPAEAAIFSNLSKNLNVESQSTLVVGGHATDGQMAVRWVLPKQHLIEIVAMGIQIQQQMAASQQTAMQKQGSIEMQMSPAATPMPAETPSQAKIESWIDKPAPDLKMVDLSGNVNRISRLKGKKIMLDFWATWCPPCKESIPELIKLRAESKPSELAIFGLSDEPVDRLNKFSKDAKINYPVIAYNESLPEPYNLVNALPTLFLIDTKGIIRDILIGYHPIQEVEARLEQLN
jgi:thiol-disulfide isomerase/thioredoxin